MLIRVGFSADPDDAFMFWGLASGTVDPRGYDFEPVIEDIQTLNEWSLEGRLEVTATSLATYPLVQDRYLLLPHGGSMGSGYGPIVVSRERLSLDELRETEILVPGKLTTAFLVLKMVLGEAQRRELLHHRARRRGRHLLCARECSDGDQLSGVSKLVDLAEIVLDRLGQRLLRHSPHRRD